MKYKIPFDKVHNFYIKYKNYRGDTKEEMIEYNRDLEEQFELMLQITPEDLERITKEELNKIFIGWLYDWNKVTGGYEDPSRILELYTKHNINPLTYYEYMRMIEKNNFNIDIIRNMIYKIIFFK